MILSFGSKETERIWNGERVNKLPNEIQEIGRRKLRMLNNSQNLSDLTFLHQTDWKNCQEISEIFILHASVINGELSLNGRMETLLK